MLNAKTDKLDICWWQDALRVVQVLLCHGQGRYLFTSDAWSKSKSEKQIHIHAHSLSKIRTSARKLSRRRDGSRTTTRDCQTNKWLKETSIKRQTNRSTRPCWHVSSAAHQSPFFGKREFDDSHQSEIALYFIPLAVVVGQGLWDHLTPHHVWKCEHILK